MKLTDKEKAVLSAFWKSEYQDGHKEPSIWSFSVTMHSGLNATSVPGVVASLTKKGLVGSSMAERGENFNEIHVTTAGHAQAVEHGLIKSRLWKGFRGGYTKIWECV